MRIRAHVVEVITVERDVEVEVPDGTPLDDCRIHDAVRAVAYMELAVPQDNPWELTSSDGLDIQVPRTKCVKVEYDPNYWGGDYGSLGLFAYVPLSLIDVQYPESPRGEPDLGRRLDAEEARLQAAFKRVTGLDPVHIVHYTFDELVDQYGNDWQDDWDSE